MANEENRRKKVITEGNGSVTVNKDEKVSGGPASQGGSKKPASSGPSTAQKPGAQGNRPGGPQQMKPTQGGKAPDGEDKGLVGDIAGSLITNAIGNALNNAVSGSQQQSSHQNSTLNLLGGGQQQSSAKASSSGCLGKIIRIVIIAAVILLLLKFLDSCGIIDCDNFLPSYDPREESEYNPWAEESKNPFVHDSQPESTPESKPETSIGDIEAKVSNKIRDYYTNLQGNGRDKVTVMIYMCGADLESSYGLATADLNEMCAAGISDKVNIIIETGGAKKWQNNIISNKTTQRYKVVKGGVQKLQDMGKQLVMTSADTLSDFIQYCADRYPADRYMLIFWDHGGGSVSGYGYDENYTSKGSMPLDQIDKALAAGGVKFDIIGFDACLMACLENAFVCEKYADFLLASEESEPGYGWYYTDWINQLSQNTSVSSEALGKTIVDTYIAHCKSDSPRSDATLSMIDLKKLAANVPEALNEFAQATSIQITQSYSTVANARSRAHEFASSSKIDQVDLIDFAQRLGTSQAKALVNALNKSIAYSKANIGNVYGVSVYFPYKRSAYVGSMASINGKTGFDSDYTACLRTFASAMSGGQIVSNGGSAYGSLSGDAYGGGTTSVTSGDMTDLLSGFFGGGSSGGFLDTLLGSYSSSGYEENYSYDTSDSLYNSLMGDSYSSGSTYGSYGSLIGSLFGGGNDSTSSGYDLTGDLLSMFFKSSENRSVMMDMAPYYAETFLDAARLTKHKDSTGTFFRLTEDEWNLVTEIVGNVFIAEADGYVDLGVDDYYNGSFKKGNDLYVDFDNTWLAVNGQIVAYYFVSYNDETGVTTGRVPCLWDNQRADLYFTIDNDGKTEFIGVKFRYEDETSTDAVLVGKNQTVGTVDFETGLVTSEASALKTGSVIKFVCDYYNADGKFESCYTLGDSLVYAGDLALSYVELDLRADQSAVFCYRLTDIYENYFWTESVYMTK